MAQVCSINSGISNKAVTLFLINVFFPLTNRNILSYYTYNRKNLHPFEIWSLKLVIGFTWPEAKQDGSLPNRTLSPNVVLRRRNSLFTASNDKTRRRLSSACRQTFHQLGLRRLTVLFFGVSLVGSGVKPFWAAAMFKAVGQAFFSYGLQLPKFTTPELQVHFVFNDM